jgi:hypothetical protein
LLSQNPETSGLFLLGGRIIARPLAPPLAHSDKSELFQNFAALHDPATIFATQKVAEPKSAHKPRKKPVRRPTFFLVAQVVLN